MHKQTLIAIVLSALLAVAYFVSAMINTRMITSLSVSGFGFFYIGAALLGGLIAYSFSRLIDNRLVRRLIFAASGLIPTLGARAAQRR